MDRRVQAGIAGALALLVGIGAWVGIAYFLGGSPATAAQVAALAAQNKQTLMDGILAGKVFYYKEERYRSEPASGFPQTTIAETWLVADSNGDRVGSVGTLRDTTGNLLGYSELHDDGSASYTIVQTGMTFPMPSEFLSDVEYSVSALWDALLAIGDQPDLVYSQGGTLAGKASQIYEQSGEGGRTYSIEVVADAPFLNKQTHYEDGVLLEWTAITEYSLLPADTVLPDPVAEAGLSSGSR